MLKFITWLPAPTEVTVRGRAGIETVKGGDLGYCGNLAANLPITDTLAFCASGAYRKTG